MQRLNVVRPCCFQRRHASGRAFTLIEIMVTIAVASILAATSVSLGTGFYRRAQLNEFVHGLGDTLAVARGEAMRRAQPMSVEAVVASSSAGSATTLVVKAADAAKSIVYTCPQAMPADFALSVKADAAAPTRIAFFLPDGQLVLPQTVVSRNGQLIASPRFISNPGALSAQATKPGWDPEDPTTSVLISIKQVSTNTTVYAGTLTQFGILTTQGDAD